MQKIIAALGAIAVSVVFIFGPGLLAADAQVLPVPVPTITVFLPGPVETIIKELPVQVPVPGPTITVEVPGPTVTETVLGNGSPAPTVTVTVTESASPGTPTDVPSTGQTTQSSGTVTPTPEPTPDPTPPVVREGLEEDDDIFISTPEAIGTSLLLLGIGGGLVAIFLAYYRGYKDSDKADAKLTKQLRDDVIGE